jgi:hypothetical protein
MSERELEQRIAELAEAAATAGFREYAACLFCLAGAVAFDDPRTTAQLAAAMREHAERQLAAIRNKQAQLMN